MPSKDRFYFGDYLNLCTSVCSFCDFIIYGDRQYEIRLMDEYPFLMVMPAIIVSNVCLISGRVLSPAA